MSTSTLPFKISLKSIFSIELAGLEITTLENPSFKARTAFTPSSVAKTLSSADGLPPRCIWPRVVILKSKIPFSIRALDKEIPPFSIEGDPLHNKLLDEYSIQVPIFPWELHGTRYIRISSQLYNHEDEYVYLAKSLSECV